MFDNAIFASLIPQFLMVLGFFSVIIAPSLTASQHTENSNKVTEITIESSIVSSSVQNINSSYHFQNHAQPQHVAVTLTNKTQLPTIPLVGEISYALFNIQRIENDENFSLFSRPPPFSLFFC